MRELPDFDGGCQCGAVRYKVTAGPGKVNVCFCDMCKRATGAPVPSFVSVARDRVTWVGTPAVYRSSDIATRGFCRTCGTPLYYAGDDSTTLGLAAGTANLEARPDVVFYFDQHPTWLFTLGSLPRPDFQPTAGNSDAKAK